MTESKTCSAWQHLTNAAHEEKYQTRLLYASCFPLTDYDEDLPGPSQVLDKDKKHNPYS